MTIEECCGTCANAKHRDSKLWCAYPIPLWVHMIGARAVPSGPSEVTDDWGQGCPCWETRLERRT